MLLTVEASEAAEVDHWVTVAPPRAQQAILG